MINRLYPKISSEIPFFKKHTIVSYLNVYNYLMLKKMKEEIHSVDIFTLDGFLLALILRCLYFKKIKRLSPDFSSYFIELFKRAEKEKKSIYIFGASEKEVFNFVSIIKEKYTKIYLAGYSNGYLDHKEYAQLSKKIIELKPDVIFVGLGSPKQEIFSCSLKKMGFEGTIYTCGAFISQTANHGLRYYPDLINKLHLRWSYRIFKEKNLLKRYFIYYPFSVLIIIYDFIKNKL